MTHLRKIHFIALTVMLMVTSVAFATMNIYVKREGSTTAPKIHVWTNDSGSDVAITNTSSWPNNLPTMMVDTDGWFKYNVTANSVGTLFRYGTFQTPDYKYYRQDVWITLNADGSRKSVTHTDPRVRVVFNSSVPAQADGCFVEGQDVSVYMSTVYPNGVVYYTTDGSDPIPNVGSTMIAYSSASISAFQSRIKAVVYANEVRVSDIVTKDFCFKKGIITITTTPEPGSNGKYVVGQTVNLTMTSNVTGFPIFYSTDGAFPYYISESKKEYTTSFVVTENSQLMAHLYLGGGYRYGRYSELVVKPIEFQEGVVFPTFTYSTNPGAKDNGSYNAGTPVQVTFDLTPFNGNFDIYYSLDGNDVDLSKIGGQSYGTNPIRYSGPFTVSENKVVYAKIYSLPTGESQGVSPMVFNFEQSNTQKNIYVKREGATNSPKIHVWKNDGGTDIAVTNTSNWPNNLPYMTATGGGWYKYDVNSNSYGVLFKYADKQTEDFKYYTSTKWILLDANGNMVSVTDTNPENSPSSNLNITTDIAPNSNGKYTVGQTINTTITSTVGCGGCAFSIYYTTDGTNPTTSTTKIIYTNSPIAVSSTTTIKAAILSLSNSVWLPVEQKNIAFENEVVPSFTYSTNPGYLDNGTFYSGTSVSTTFYLSYPSDNPNWEIYYSLDNTEVNLANKNTGSQNAIKYTGAFTVTTNKVVYAKLYNIVTGQSQGVSPMIFTFVNPPKTVWVKRQGTTQQAPKIHAWTNDSGSDVAITNNANWPNNLPYMSVTGGGWYKFDINSNSYGVLFKYADKQTVDFKYYTTSKWILLDANGNLVSVTDTMPAAARETAATTDLLDQFVISPNPTTDNFTVNFSNGKTEIATISIYNLSGKLLFTEAIPEGNMINKDYSANAIGLSDGVYLVAVTTATTNEIKRLVIK